MQLLISRGQSENLFGRTNFRLNGQIELTQAEHALVAKYKMREWPAYVGDVYAELKRSALVAIPLAVIVFTIMAYIWPHLVDFTMTGPIVFFSLYVLIVCLYYNQTRETILLSDLLTGRPFKCKSIVDISDQEKFIRQIASHVFQLLEDMKNWGGREVVDVEPPLKRTYFGSPAPRPGSADDGDETDAAVHQKALARKPGVPDDEAEYQRVVDARKREDRTAQPDALPAPQSDGGEEEIAAPGAGARIAKALANMAAPPHARKK